MNLDEKKYEKEKKGVDENPSPVLYYDSRADESRAGLKSSVKLETVQDVP